MNPQFYRSALLIGASAIDTLSKKRVALFGLGGVGSYVAESLARGGVGSLLLVDNDTVDITNINRQLPATHETVGQFKTEVVASRIKSINPDAKVEIKTMFCLPDNISDILVGEFDYIVDAVDTVSAKLAIAEFGFNKGIPVISCMGAGNKLDPTRFVVADITETRTCPLCRVMRRELKKRGVSSLKVVYSEEPPLTPDYSQLPPDAQDNSMRPSPGSMSFVPPVAGMIAGGEVIKDLIKTAIS